MAKKLDLTGKKINRLKILQYAGLDSQKNTIWKCLCDCGTIVTIRGSSIKRGTTKSCGCIQKEHAAKTSHKNKTHGHSVNKKTSSIYNIWTNMKSRCTNQNNPSYHNYGGRGIKICNEWLKFENFFKDMGEPPTNKHQIDRINNDDNYYPENCQWTTSKCQNRNKRNNNLITFKGITQCITDWSKTIGINTSTIASRINRGWSVDKTMTTPTDTNKTKLCFNDILLIPRYSELRSRNSPNISTHIGNVPLRIPIISSPMDTITGPEMLCSISECGGLGILTRYITMQYEDGINRQINEIRYAIKNGATHVGCAIGIKNNTVNHIKSLLEIGCHVICVDVAHGDHKLVHKRIEEILSIKNHNPFTLLVGNICTPEGAIGLAKLGVDAIKVGIGSGAICTTRVISGFGIPQLSAILDVSNAINHLYPNVSIIADGGLRSTGDMVKSLWAGADACMIGYMIAGTNNTPKIDNKITYRGMSSRAVSGRPDIAPEGIEIEVGDKGDTKEVLEEYIKGIRSGLAMGGATNLSELREKVKHVIVSPLSMEETLPRSN